MQAHARPQVSVTLSVTYKGRRRPSPVWVMRYRLPSGKDSKKVIGLAWKKKGRPPHGFLTEADALLEAEAFAAEHSADGPRRAPQVPSRAGLVPQPLHAGEGAPRLDASRVHEDRPALGRASVARRAQMGRSSSRHVQRRRPVGGTSGTR